MSQQPSSNAPGTIRLSDIPRPGSRRLIVVSELGGGLALCLCIVVMLVLLFRDTPVVEAGNARLSTELGKDGQILKDTRTIPANSKEIHLQFSLEKPANAKASLEFRWYVGDRLINSSSGVYEGEYVSSTMKLDPNEPGGFPRGNYHVEVWSKNTMILSKPFVVE